MSKVFVFDASICNGCYCCQIACKDEHCGNDWSPYAKPQPDTGQFWLKLDEYVRGTVPKVKMHYVATLCNHCDDPACMEACPVAEAIYKRGDGLVVIDPEKCTGCKNCADACASDAIYLNEALNVAQKCTGCAHLLDAGWTETRCTDACPTGALKFLEEEDAKAQGLLAGAEHLHPAGEKPRAYYQNIPKKFIAGTLYDPKEKEVVIGATLTLTSDGSMWTTTTDGFGDFWFEGLAEGSYDLEINARGFAPRVFTALSTERDVNLGDVALS